MKSGIWYGIGAYVTWGLLPLYWKQIGAVPAGQLIGHRIGWSFLTLVAIIFVSNQWTAVRAAISRPGVVRMYGLAAALITINWFIYVWAVNHGFIVETSPGYFINPLVSVVFYAEPFSGTQLVGFVMVWAGLIIFGLDGFVSRRAPMAAIIDEGAG